MPVGFEPDRYGVVVLSKWQSNSSCFIVFFGSHFDGKVRCWDVGFFDRRSGNVRRLHFNKGEHAKEEAIVKFEEAKDVLSKVRKHEEDVDPIRIISPN